MTSNAGNGSSCNGSAAASWRWERRLGCRPRPTDPSMTCLFCTPMAVRMDGKKNERSCSASHDSRAPGDRRQRADDLRPRHQPRTPDVRTASPYRSPDRGGVTGRAYLFYYMRAAAPAIAKIIEQVES